MKKYQVLKVLSWLLFLPPGPTPNHNLHHTNPTVATKQRKKQSKWWFINLQFIISFVAAFLISYCLIMEYLYSNRYSNGRPDNNDLTARSSVTNAPTEQLPQSPVDAVDPFHTAMPGGPGFVIVFALALKKGNMVVVNVCLRLLAWIHYIPILQLLLRMENLHMHSTYPRQWLWSLRWSRNETIYFCVVAVFHSVRTVGSYRDLTEYMEGYPWSVIYGGPVNVQQSNGGSSVWLIVDAILFGSASVLGGPIVNEFIGFLLLSLVTFVSRNLKTEPTLELPEGASPLITPVDTIIQKTRPTIFADEISRDWIKELSSGRKSTMRRLSNIQHVFDSSQSSFNFDHFKLNTNSKRVKILFYTSRYFEWYVFWLECRKVVGLALTIIFLNTTIDLCVSFFIAITSSIDNGITNSLSIENICSVFLTVFKMLCFGNANQQLRLATNSVADVLASDDGKMDPPAHDHLRGNNAPSQNTKFQYESSIQDKIGLKLLDFMKECPMSLSALNFFEVSRETLTNMAGVIVTYLMILLQFYWSQNTNAADAPK